MSLVRFCCSTYSFDSYGRLRDRSLEHAVDDILMRLRLEIFFESIWALQRNLAVWTLVLLRSMHFRTVDSRSCSLLLAILGIPCIL